MRSSSSPDEEKENIETWEIADILAMLADRSLVLWDADTGRYQLLETIRAYGRDLVAETPEVELLRRRHASHFLSLTEEAEPKLYGPDQLEWLQRLNADHDNLRAAQEWSAGAPGEEEIGLKICAELWWYWYRRGHFSEGRERLEAALVHTSSGKAIPAHAKAINGAGALAWAQSDYESAQRYFEQALELNRVLDDRKAQAANLHNLGIVAHHRGFLDQAKDLYEQAYALCHELGHRTGEASALTGMGTVARDMSDYATAREKLEGALEINREMGDRNAEAGTLNNLGLLSHTQGNHRAARLLFERSLAINRELGSRAREASCLNNLGLAARGLGEYEEAQTLHWQALSLWHEAGDRQALAECLEALASLATLLKDPRTGAAIWGAAERLRAEIGAPMLDPERPFYDECVATSTEALGKKEFDRAWSEGRAMTLEESVEYALGNASACQLGHEM